MLPSWRGILEFQVLELEVEKDRSGVLSGWKQVLEFREDKQEHDTTKQHQSKKHLAWNCYFEGCSPKFAPELSQRVELWIPALGLFASFERPNPA